MIHITNVENVYEDIKTDHHLFDTSNYPDNNVYGVIPQGAKVPGRMKDEVKGKIITDFVGLRAKMYSIRVDGQADMKRAKGVKSYLLKKDITFNDYMSSLFNKSVWIKEQNSVRSINHQVFSIAQRRVVLSPYDDKRFIMDDEISTLNNKRNK